MNDDRDNGTEWASLRPLTQQLILAIYEDEVPGAAACLDFGIESPAHYEAVYYAFRNGDVTPEQLEAALGNGPKLTALMRNAPHNPHRQIRYRTVWDELSPEVAEHRNGAELRQEAKVYDLARERAKRRRDRDHEPEQ